MFIDPNAICRGIEQELEDTPEHSTFEVLGCRAEGSLFCVQVRNLSPHPSPLDESCEGARAWWADRVKGVADVLAVIPEDDEIVLRFATAQPPVAGGKMLLYPPRFLDRLLAVWHSPACARDSIQWAETVLQRSTPSSTSTSSGLFPWLRPAQRKAFDLTQWGASFLWGPPGTGKTTTVGTLVASYLLERPDSRVLLISTTNVAVDLALIAVDKALQEAARSASSAESIRNSCKRIGSHFQPKHYEGRTHLLSLKNPVLIHELISHASKKPDERDTQAIAGWKTQDEFLRQELRQTAREVLIDSRLAAMTTTRAAFDFEMLRSLPQRDLVVFDEASQVAIAHAAMLGPLGRQSLFAGDPEQLAPVVRSEQADTVRWLGRSAFDLREGGVSAGATCFLDEQSRMARPICEVVSKTFYEGRLVVASGCEKESAWRRECEVGVGESERFQLVAVTAEGQWSAKFHGWVRGESAEHIITLLKHHVHSVDPEDIAVLTPFRAQRSVIRLKLREAGLAGVTVSTVHRAQGSERRIVLFDPVMAATGFLNGRAGCRLINVALSRAKALLYVFASIGDLKNPVFANIAGCLGRRDELQRTPLFCQLVNHPDFPRIMQGQVFAYHGMKLVFKEVIHGGASFVTKEVTTQQRRQISMDGARTRCGDPNHCPLQQKPNGTPPSQCVP
jgi:DNA replication ATP-dependent helicase Dna2